LKRKKRLLLLKRKKRTKCAYEKPTKRGAFSERSPECTSRAARARLSRVCTSCIKKTTTCSSRTRASPR
jgi:hypothetical protein